jgi:hypothetical protein
VVLRVVEVVPVWGVLAVAVLASLIFGSGLTSWALLKPILLLLVVVVVLAVLPTPPALALAVAALHSLLAAEPQP